MKFRQSPYLRATAALEHFDGDAVEQEQEAAAVAPSVRTSSSSSSSSFASRIHEHRRPVVLAASVAAS